MTNFANPFTSNKWEGVGRSSTVSAPTSMCPNCLDEPMYNGHCSQCNFRNGHPVFSEAEQSQDPAIEVPSDISPKNMIGAKDKQPAGSLENIASYQRNFSYGRRDDDYVSPVSSSHSSPQRERRGAGDYQSLSPSDSISNYPRGNGGGRDSIPAMPAPFKPPSPIYAHGYGQRRDSSPDVVSPSNKPPRWNESFIQGQYGGISMDEYPGNRVSSNPPPREPPNLMKALPPVKLRQYTRGEEDLERQGFEDIDLRERPQDSNWSRTRNFWGPREADGTKRSRWRMISDNVSHDCLGIGLCMFGFFVVGMTIFIATHYYYISHHPAIE